MLRFAFVVVREERGPYSDPQHPYLYEEDDVWMAPGFINQFYEVSWMMHISSQIFSTRAFQKIKICLWMAGS